MNSPEMTDIRTFAVAIALSVVLITGYCGAQTVRCTTWNLEWFPNGSAKEKPVAQQEQRIKEAADVLRPIISEWSDFNDRHREYLCVLS
jgi:hypothetical protein